MMDYEEEYKKLKTQVHFELNKKYRLRVIIDVVLDHLNLSKKYLYVDRKNDRIAYVKQMISYIGFSIYGIDYPLIAENIGYNHTSSVFTANNALKHKLTVDRQVNIDLDNIRMKLGLCLSR